MFSLQEKVIAITGSKGLLGSCFVNSLQKQGATVVQIDIAPAESDTFNYFSADIGDEGAMGNVIDSIFVTYGKLDGWINNAYPRTADWANKLEEVSFQSWRQNVDMHLNGYFLCSKMVLTRMQQQEFGCLINMSSIYGHKAPDFSIYEGTEMTMPVAYSAIKGGINNLTRYFASYFGPSGVRVNSISPGGIWNRQPESFVERYNKKVPLRRMGKPEDIAAAAAFLLSDEAGYITGHNMVIDGGWSIV